MARPDVKTLKRSPAWASKLSDYEEEIRGLRKKRKSYREIAAYLREKRGIEISYNGVFSFLKARKRHHLYVLPETPFVPPRNLQQKSSPARLRNSTTKVKQPPADSPSDDKPPLDSNGKEMTWYRFNEPVRVEDL